MRIRDLGALLALLLDGTVEVLPMFSFVGERNIGYMEFAGEGLE